MPIFLTCYAVGVEKTSIRSLTPMEPITTWSIATIATIIATKGLEKSGEKLGEGVMKLGSHPLGLLKQKAPETATAIEQAPAQLPEQQVTALSQQVEQVNRLSSKVNDSSPSLI